MKRRRFVIKEVRHINDQDMQFIHCDYDSEVNERCYEFDREY